MATWDRDFTRDAPIERASRGELTLGFAGRTADAIAKAGDALAKLVSAVDDIAARLGRLEGRTK